MRASRGLKWENKMYKPKRSIVRPVVNLSYAPKLVLRELNTYKPRRVEKVRQILNISHPVQILKYFNSTILPMYLYSFDYECG